MSKSNTLCLPLPQSVARAGTDRLGQFKELLQEVRSAGSPSREASPSAAFSFDEKVPDLTVADADKQTNLSEEIPAEAVLRGEAQPGVGSSIDSAPAIPETSDASLAMVNVPHDLPRHADHEKIPTSVLSKSKHTKKSESAEEQIETKTVSVDLPFVPISNVGGDASTAVVQQSIPLHRGASPVEQNAANPSKITTVGIPVANARENQAIPAEMDSVASSGTVPDLVLPRNHESDVNVEADTHDIEPVLSVIPRHAPLATVNVTMSDAATFQPFLLRGDRHSDVVMRAENDSAAVGPELLNQTATTAEPIKRLELQWNDVSLGKISLTAELRDGALHAVVDSSRAATGVNATDLHRFLEDNHVPLHALQVSGQPIVSQASRDTSWNSARDVSAGTGGSQSFSHQGQERNGSSAGEQRHTHSRTERYEDATRTVKGSAVIPSQQSDQRLSIHI